MPFTSKKSETCVFDPENILTKLLKFLLFCLRDCTPGNFLTACLVQQVICVIFAFSLSRQYNVLRNQWPVATMSSTPRVLLMSVSGCCLRKQQWHSDSVKTSKRCFYFNSCMGEVFWDQVFCPFLDKCFGTLFAHLL